MAAAICNWIIEQKDKRALDKSLWVKWHWVNGWLDLMALV